MQLRFGLNPQFDFLMTDHIFEFACFAEAGRILVDGQGVEMRLAASDLGAVAVAEVVGETEMVTG